MDPETAIEPDRVCVRVLDDKPAIADAMAVRSRYRRYDVVMTETTRGALDLTQGLWSPAGEP